MPQITEKNKKEVAMGYGLVVYKNIRIQAEFQAPVLKKQPDTHRVNFLQASGRLCYTTDETFPGHI